VTEADEDLAAGPHDRQAERLRILLVEDDAGDALLVEELLVDTGLPHELHWKQTLQAALREAAALTPDCILADLHLPDSSGLRAVQALQQVYPAVSVIVLTGLAESQVGVQAVASGAQDYLVKGQVDADQLRRALSYAVQRKRAELANAELQLNRMRAQENARLERGLLPTPLVTSAAITATTRYLPGRDHALLGGDFLDVVQTPDGTVHAVIGDVSGHGPDEAALGVCLRIGWRTLAFAGHHGVDALSHLEQLLIAERGESASFVTCGVLSIDPRSARGVMHLAGHHEPVLLDKTTGRYTVLPAKYGTALGIAPGQRNWTATRFALPESGALLLYTDGLTEGYVDSGQRRLGVQGLLELLERAPDDEPDAMLNHVVTTARRLNAGLHADDVAIMCLSWQ
jgi:serine phosphatase RsbU (regulator of sigma subunit)